MTERPDIVCFGQQDWDACWVTKQHLMSRLAARGHRVLFVDPATATPRHGTEVEHHELREVAERLWVFHHRNSPLTPRADPLWRQVRLARAFHRLGLRRPVRFILIPQHPLRRLGIGGAATIYFAEDEWTAFDGYTQPQRDAMRLREEQLVRTSDLALAVSPALLERFKRFQPHSYLQENAVDTGHLSPARLAAAAPDPAVASLPRPRIGFVGQVDARLDVALLEALARRHPHWQIVLVGRVGRGAKIDQLQRMPNVHVLGYRPYADLPRVLREFDVCLVPYRHSALTHGCNPLKVYEYLATGRPVVTADLPGLGQARSAVTIADTPEAFEAAVAEALADPDRGRVRRLTVAEANSWEVRTDLLEARIAQAQRLAGARREKRRKAVDFTAALDPKEDAFRQLYPRSDVRPYEHAVVAAAATVGRTIAAARRRSRRPRILVARHGFLGDLVASLPALHALRRRFPNAEVVVAVGPSTSVARTILGRDVADEVRVLPWLEGRDRGAQWRGIRDLIGEGFDLALTGHSYFFTRAALLAGAAKRVGLDDGDPRQRLLQVRVPFRHDRHEADNGLAVAEALGAEAHDAERIPTIWLEPERLERGRGELLRQGIVPAGQYLVIHPGSKRPSRRWPIERFAALVERLLREHPEVEAVVTGTAEEADLAEQLEGALPAKLRGRIRSSAGATSFEALIALLDRARLVISNDTGVMHLAHARARPLLALLGPENDQRWGPYPLARAPTVALRHEVPCAPCDRFCCSAQYCMRRLEVDQVFDAAQRLLRASTAEDPRGTYPVERIVTSHDWMSLSQAGLSPPAFQLFVDCRGSSDGAERYAALRSQSAGQVYPNVMLAAVVSAGDEVEPDDPAVQRIICREGDAAAAWRAVIGASRAPFVAEFVPGGRWHDERLAEDAAALQRSRDAAAACGRFVFRFDELTPDVRSWRSLTLRHAAARRLLGGPDKSASRPSRAAATLAVEGALA